MEARSEDQMWSGEDSLSALERLSNATLHLMVILQIEKTVI